MWVLPDICSGTAWKCPVCTPELLQGLISARHVCEKPRTCILQEQRQKPAEKPELLSIVNYAFFLPLHTTILITWLHIIT